MNALLVSHPAKLRAFNFGHPCPSLVKGEVLSPEKIRATTGGIASRCTEYCHSPIISKVQPSLAPHHILSSLVKGGVLSDK